MSLSKWALLVGLAEQVPWPVEVGSRGELWPVVADWFSEALKVGCMQHLFEQLSAGALAVTSTRRLSRYLLEQYASYKSQEGVSAWATPKTATWEEWILAEWRGLTRTDPSLGSRVVLDDQQEAQLWESIIQRAMERSPNYTLLQTSATARAAKETWQLIHDWQIPLESLKHTYIEDTQAFYEWTIEFAKHIERNGWLSICEISSLIVKQIQTKHWLPRHKILFVGFDHWLPSQKSLIRELEAANGVFEQVAQPKVNEYAEVVSCPDRCGEFEAAAQWSKQLLNEGAIGPIGVIVDDLVRQRDQIEIIFDQVLHSRESLSFSDERRRTFHISLGKPLAEYPVIAAALTLLGFLLGPRPTQDVTRILHTPFISGGVSEMFVRASVDLKLRQLGWDYVSPTGLLRLVEKSRLPAVDLMRSLKQVLRNQPRQSQSPSAWAGTFIEWLSMFGWPGDRTLSSVEYQTVQAWRELLSRLARFNIVTPRLSSKEAFSRISQLAQRRVFQPRSESAPVQIMGVLEASGMQFSHLWVTGMSDDSWPAPIRLNPFLPYEVQRRFALPGAVAEYELERSQRVAGRLIDSAGRVVISYPRQSGEQLLHLSPIYQHLPRSPRQNEYVSLTRYIQQSAPALETVSDTYGPVLGSTPPHGGVGIFKDQAACPFRAFAHHRLAATALPTVEPGLNPAERGILVHACMADLWREIKTQGNLMALAEDELGLVLKKHIDGAVDKLAQYDSSRFRQTILDIERQRLQGLLTEWLSVESDRDWFEVEQIEQKVSTRFSGIDIGLRIDRVDQLQDGRRAIIDYKTGRNVRVEHWLGDRPEDPQLPLYLLCATTEISALAFARIRKGDSVFKGLSEDEGFAKGVHRQEGWVELKAQWRQALSALAEQFKAGCAQVDPKDNRACQTCDVISFCRIFDGRRRSVGRYE